jgi:predicted cobalt transporter CbtA
LTEWPLNGSSPLIPAIPAFEINTRVIQWFVNVPKSAAGGACIMR